MRNLSPAMPGGALIRLAFASAVAAAMVAWVSFLSMGFFWLVMAD
jgi:hypothetical protein